MHYDANVKEAMKSVAALANERPDWIPVLEAALEVSDRVQEYGGEFAGAWVIDELERRVGHPKWLPNLRVLVTYGLIEKSGESVRGGRRAYYRFAATKNAIKEALALLSPKTKVPVAGPASSRFRFVGAGDSGEAGSDFARRSADLTYEPPPWR